MRENPYYTAAQHGDFDVFGLGDFVLEQGATLRNASLAYKTFGRLNKEADQVLLRLFITEQYLDLYAY
ncbi:MAG: hypothetical protein LC541_06985 [Candidatus Thiodiazotropha sp.]|nr:hypothetical protein [Candidatus Thiodiazotropha sp.]MCM8883061.1 hypothetical protein [Candidatus Thiodiazotropha sp.]MCM8918845.1 hypothetical protein [Candidatus Thiodiazotropha sp.]